MNMKPGGSDFKEVVVSIDRVIKVTKGGRNFRFRVLVVVGNEKEGKVGYGIGKSKETTEAIYKAVERAKKNAKKIHLINGTIAHQWEEKFGGAHVFIKPASKGTGLIAGGALRRVLEMAGVKDILSKSKGSSNPYNVVKAAINALLHIRKPINVSKVREVSLDKVFNG